MGELSASYNYKIDISKINYLLKGKDLLINKPREKVPLLNWQTEFLYIQNDNHSKMGKKMEKKMITPNV